MLSNPAARSCFGLTGIVLVATLLPAQVIPPVPAPPPPAAAPVSQGPAVTFRPVRPNAPPPGWWDITAVTQSVEGPWRRLRGKASMESSEMLLRAEEIDYNEEEGYAEARGNVYFENYVSNERLWAEKVEYNVREETGKFYKVRGSGTPRIDARPGILTSSNPFYFEGQWAERLKNKYVLHNGFVTNCRLPNPWWVLRGPKFDIVPGDRAIAHNSVFWLKRIPLFYTPFFYKSLERVPRRSGFLTPNLGNSSRRGKMLGAGYYWAINRSYDATYRVQYFTQRGYAHNIDARGKPRAGTDFNAFFYGVQDRGELQENGTRVKQGGYMFSIDGISSLPRGFHGRASINHLSSMLFRQAFTESFNEAIFSESHSVGFVTKHWPSFDFNAAALRLENFQSLTPDDVIVIRKVPEFDLGLRPRTIWRHIPVWVSLYSNAGLVRRAQPLFQTRQWSERVDLYPRVTTALRWKDFHLLPSFAIRESHYGESQSAGRVAGENVNRHARELTLDLIAPSLSRVYDGKGWLGDRVKHVIEPRFGFRHVRGVDGFDRYIRFDEIELMSNTTEADASITNRLYVKRNGVVSELLSWQIWQRRYFDPDFGGAVVEGRRNVIRSAVDMTAYAFLDEPRRYSPVISVLRLTPMPGFGVEWRSDYDSGRRRYTNSGITADARLSRYYISLGHNYVRSNPQVLTPSANQFRGLIAVGDVNRRGWNAAFTAIYDFRIGQMQYATTQVTYNTDCCGFSVQYRRFSFGPRNENQFRLAFAVANIGSFGTLKKQERLF
jgi:LPS-assembly protein